MVILFKLFDNEVFVIFDWFVKYFVIFFCDVKIIWFFDEVFCGKFYGII